MGRLDVLANHAGIFVSKADGPPPARSHDAIEATFRSNDSGTVAVTQSRPSPPRKAESARIVDVSSGLGPLAPDGDRSNPQVGAESFDSNASKAALNMLTVQLACELRETSIKVNSADPGYTATELDGRSGTQTIPEGAAEIIRLALPPDSGPTGI